MKLNVSKKILATIIISIFLFLIKTNSALADNYNLIPNPSFEFGTSSPLEWETNNSSTCINSQNTPQSSFEWSSEITQSGSQSLALKNIYWEDIYNPDIPGLWITSNYIETPRNPKGYEFSTWVYASKNNHSIYPRLTVCTYDINNKLSTQSEITLNEIPEAETWFELKSVLILSDPKIKIILGSRCSYEPPQQTVPPCTGSLWFDNTTVRPINSMIAHTFNDINEDSNLNWGEENLTQWEVSLYQDSDCTNNHIKTTGWTNKNGDIIFTVYSIFPPTSFPPGNYSIQQTFRMLKTTPYAHVVDARDEGWINTTPTCQNVTLNDGETPAVYFGNYKAPSFPYLSQLDPAWKDLTYDHASTSNPFFCGTTIGGCGCAITSSAMLLKYYGVTKAPDGSETNPNTLNTWLKNNSGYAFGALKWNSIAAYSVKANEVFGTQKIRFVGTGAANDFTTLDSDLSNSKPDIISEPGHFIVATKKDGTDYGIADPAYKTRTTLASYSNSFTGIRRYEKTNTDLSAIYISTPTPNDLFITDSLGRSTGKNPDTGEILTQIPNSHYFVEPSFTDQTDPNSQVPSSGVTTLVIINPGEGTFNLNSKFGPIDISAYDTLGNIQVKNFSTIEPDTFELNYSAVTGSDFNVYQKVSIDLKPQNLNKGNGVFPLVIKSDDNFNVQDIDFQSIRLTPPQISPIKFPLLISSGKDSKKDMQIFFLASQIPPNENLCLTGLTVDNIAFKSCSTFPL